MLAMLEGSRKMTHSFIYLLIYLFAVTFASFINGPEGLPSIPPARGPLSAGLGRTDVGTEVVKGFDGTAPFSPTKHTHSLCKNNSLFGKGQCLPWDRTSQPCARLYLFWHNPR